MTTGSQRNELGLPNAPATVGYISRTAVEREILDFLSADSSACCIVRGAPGSGKSTLAATLIERHGYVHHFLRPGSTRSILARDPYAFLASVGFQLRDRYGPDLFPEAVVIDINARVHGVSVHGSVVGADIGRLIAVPWRSTTLKISVQAGDVSGKVIGARIAEVADDYRQIPLTAFLGMALLDPLRRLAQLHPEERVVLWVDGLDDEAELTTRGVTGISSILPVKEDLSEIGNLALVISSRPSPVLDRFVVAKAHVFALDDVRFASDTAQVVSELISREFADPEVKRALTIAERGANDVAEAVTAGCAGNMLYLRQFFLGVRGGYLKKLMAGGMPEGLHEIYSRLLTEVVGTAGSTFSTAHLPLICCLAVALRPMTIAQLAAITMLRADRVKTTLATDLRPYLDVRMDGTTPGYALYHGSFRDCLVDSAYETEQWHVSLPAAHSLVARHYLAQAEKGWESLDDYGLDALVDHLAHAEPAERSRLADVVAEPLRLAQRKRYGSNTRFMQGLATAALAGRGVKWAAPMSEASRLAYMASRLAEAGTRMPAAAVTLLIRFGMPQRALAMITDDLAIPRAIQLRAAAIAGFASIDGGSPTIVRILLSDGVDRLARANDEDAHHFINVLLAPCPADARIVTPELVKRIAEVFNAGRSYWSTPSALTEIGRLVAVVDRENAREVFQSSYKAIAKFARSSAPLEYERLLRTLVAFDMSDALAALQRIPLRPSESIVDAVLAVARGLRESNPEGARSLHDQIRDFVAQFADLYDKALGLCALAKYEHECTMPVASETTREALAAANAMWASGIPGSPSTIADVTRRARLLVSRRRWRSRVRTRPPTCSNRRGSLSRRTAASTSTRSAKSSPNSSAKIATCSTRTWRKSRAATCVPSFCLQKPRCSLRAIPKARGGRSKMRSSRASARPAAHQSNPCLPLTAHPIAFRRPRGSRWPSRQRSCVAINESPRRSSTPRPTRTFASIGALTCSARCSNGARARQRSGGWPRSRRGPPKQATPTSVTSYPYSWDGCPTYSSSRPSRRRVT
jgi:hypothetical protein